MLLVRDECNHDQSTITDTFSQSLLFDTSCSAVVYFAHVTPVRERCYSHCRGWLARRNKMLAMRTCGPNTTQHDATAAYHARFIVTVAVRPP